MLDQLLAVAHPKSALYKNGPFDELKKALAERKLNAKFGHHLVGGEPNRRPKSCNGYGRKMVLTDTGKVAIDALPDRLGTSARR